MAPHHDDHARHHLSQEYDAEREREPERPPFHEPMEMLEMDRNSRGGPGWTFDWSFNIGHVLAIITVIGGCSSTYFGIKAEIQDQAKETS